MASEEQYLKISLRALIVSRSVLVRCVGPKLVTLPSLVGKALPGRRRERAYLGAELVMKIRKVSPKKQSGQKMDCAFLGLSASTNKST